MTAPEDQPLTAADLMSRDVQTIGSDLPLGEAARELARLGVRGAPVVDGAGRCVGVLSVTDLSRWAGGRGTPVTPPPRACSFQAVDREPGGGETVRCLHAEGVCPFQRARPTAGGGPAVVCIEPHGIPTDWQVVESPPGPAVVRDVMTTGVVHVAPDTPVPELARVMLDRGIHRVLVLDPAGRPVGVVCVTDLLQLLAHPEVVAPGPGGARPGGGG